MAFIVSLCWIIIFQRSICTEPLKELSNAGASGSIFYVSSDDQFIIKTVQHKEAEFLQKLLPGYYMVGLSEGSFFFASKAHFGEFERAFCQTMR